ncbi:MAG: AmmeMemoRadiSam system protein B, partial [Acidobacteria bacterium]
MVQADFPAQQIRDEAMIRKAAVAGSFYPAEPDQLVAFLDDLEPSPADSLLKAKAVIVPHAGYVYSGRLAAEVFSRVQLPRRFVILCPNHTGMGAALAIMSQGGWETPLGLATIDAELAAAIKRSHRPLDEDTLAHRNEHSLEVQLPFLQHRLGNDFQFVPICIGRGSLEPLVNLGASLGETLKAWPEPVLIVSSS